MVQPCCAITSNVVAGLAIEATAFVLVWVGVCSVWRRVDIFVGSDATLAWPPCVGGLLSLRNSRADMKTDSVTCTHLSALRVVFDHVKRLPGC
jgi:hypothetical protein